MTATRLLFPILGLLAMLFPPSAGTEEAGSSPAVYRAVLSRAAGENDALLYIENEIRRLGVSAETRDFSGLSGGHSFSRIIDAVVPGALPSTLIVAAPVDGDGFAAALALSLLADTGDNPPVTLRFLFLGGEGGAPLGSRLFLQDFFPQDPAAVLYLNPRGAGEYVFQTGARGVVAPSWMVKRIGDAASVSGLRHRVLGVRNQTFRFGLADTVSPAKEYLRAGYPAISVEGGIPGGETGFDDFRGFFRTFLRENSGGFPGEWDRHYVFFRFGNRSVIIEEPVIIGVLLLVLGLSFLYPLIFRGYMLRYLRTFGRNFWNLPLFLVVIGAFLFIGTLTVRGAALARGTPGLHTHAPFVFFALKISFAAFLSALTFHNLRRLPISKNGSFYSAAAIFFLFINVVLFSIINLSYGYYFLWAYIVAILFSIFKNRLVKFLLIFAAPFWLYTVTYDTFTLPEPELIRILIESPVKGNLLLAFIVLPFFLMLVRMDLLFRHPKKGKSGFGLKIFTALFAAVSAALLSYALLFDPYAEIPQPLHVREFVDPGENIHTLELTSPSPLGELDVDFGGASFSVSTGKRNLTLDLDAPPDMFRKTVRSEGFLDRVTYTLRLEPRLPTEKVDFFLRSDEPLVVYDANFPYSPDISGGAAEIHIGRNPPVPLEIVLTLPGRLRARGEILYRSPGLSGELSVSGRPLRVSTTSLVRDSFDLKADE